MMGLKLNKVKRTHGWLQFNFGFPEYEEKVPQTLLPAPTLPALALSSSFPLTQTVPHRRTRRPLGVRGPFQNGGARNCEEKGRREKMSLHVDSL
ncbi:apelin receptor early endogenous ligand isoform X1 [Corythoichthys intestinalis]|uniref:apelin receptor early endogenous ligand isoform X1 n=1 Tax=Corythoichthys intestinalis TaxID=161448 RepID=UPI0025A612B9|nr:apelin receptor early endogenous ligand isoform X1 [Corythoichthys intestinalis]